MQNVSTKRGDQGQTDLADGTRVPKDSLRIEVIGSLDEFNARLGWARTQLGTRFKQEKETLKKIQNALYLISAEIALFTKSQIEADFLEVIETRSKKLQDSMEADWHSQFVLPGGTSQASSLDLARTVCRRAERRLVSLGRQQQIRPLLFKVMNRLSDYLYVLRCSVNHQLGHEEEKHQPVD